MALDIDFVRAQFDQLAHQPEPVFCANAGGSLVANQVNAVLTDYNTRCRVQPYERYAPSDRAGRAMDRALDGWARALGIDRAELTVGPSTSLNTYVVAQAAGAALGPGDEIIVTDQDHEANSGAWRRMAEARGATVREWQVDPGNGLLDPDGLEALLTERTRWVFFPHCSNLAGTVNDIADLVARVRRHGTARVFVDAVAQAPHRLYAPRTLGVDGYAFSLYKVFGPHQGILYLARDLVDTLAPQGHYFNAAYPDKRFNPAGPQHAQVAAAAGVLDYFDALHRHHFGDDDEPLTPARLDAVGDLVAAHEHTLATPILDRLANSDRVRLVGKPHAGDGDRAPTIAFAPLTGTARALCEQLQDLGIGCESGHFYAHRLVRSLGLDPEDGVVRISLVHYANAGEVERIVDALDRVLA